MITLVNTNNNKFLAYLDALEAAADEGLGDDSATFLKFKRGSWSTGPDESPVPAGDYIAVVPLIQRGWQKWSFGRPVGRRMAPMHEPEIMRDTLDDLESGLWPMKDGKPSDPWTFTCEVPLIRMNDGEKFLFATSSSGGHRSVRKLTKAYAVHNRSASGSVGELPIVQLGSNSYKHETFGVIFVPVFKVIGWIPDEITTASHTPPAAQLPKPLDDGIPF